MELAKNLASETADQLNKLFLRGARNRRVEDLVLWKYPLASATVLSFGLGMWYLFCWRDWTLPFVAWRLFQIGCVVGVIYSWVFRTPMSILRSPSRFVDRIYDAAVKQAAEELTQVLNQTRFLQTLEALGASLVVLAADTRLPFQTVIPAVWCAFFLIPPLFAEVRWKARARRMGTKG
eukprot:Hpha_TRINITY_DN28482_c0_g1::TRINITY_DN28482_c0_g1_i1::g.183920::m.183920